jgi:hypothetical protein
VEYGEFKSLMESLGITDAVFNANLYGQLCHVDALKSGLGGEGLEFAASVIKGSKPNDQFEVMLASQMAVFQLLTMKLLRQLHLATGTPQQESSERTVTKLARTFTDQMLAMKRYRTGGEQKVTVQHVSVNEGGKAIVGNVTQALERSTVAPPLCL